MRAAKVRHELFIRKQDWRCLQQKQTNRVWRVVWGRGCSGVHKFSKVLSHVNDNFLSFVNNSFPSNMASRMGQGR